MTVRTSTGFNTALLEKVDSVMANFVIDLYGGTQPLNPNDSQAQVLLARVTLDGGAFVEGVAANGLNLDTAVEGLISKPAADNWKYTGLANGTARWFRMRGNVADDNSSSKTLLRIDGAIGTTSGDMQLPNVNITVGAPGVVGELNVRFQANN